MEFLPKIGIAGILVFFIIGYLFITLEHLLKINKAAVALLMAVICWTIYFVSTPQAINIDIESLNQYLAQDSQIVIFLLGAMTIVELIDSHRGFGVITDCISTRSKRKMLWLIAVISFFLSSVLDNLTTTIVMISLLRKLIFVKEDRLFIGAIVVIAANAGGAWTPIGDVTTTMLWIGGQISTVGVMKSLFLPSVVCLLVPLLIQSLFFRGDYPEIPASQKLKSEPKASLVFIVGLGALVFVPILKVLTGLPPFIGILLGLGVLWLITDLVHYKHEEREHLRVPHVMTRVDISSALFFLGILLSINALEVAGLLDELAGWIGSQVNSIEIVALIIGLISAVIDNVPLVAATMGMFSLEAYPPDSNIWNLIAYCAGTGGSILIIGSAAGIAFMGLEKVSFGWYLRRISLLALFGYLAGFGIYVLFEHLGWQV